jgi:hypothetical protein
MKLLYHFQQQSHRADSHSSNFPDQPIQTGHSVMLPMETFEMGKCLFFQMQSHDGKNATIAAP